MKYGPNDHPEPTADEQQQRNEQRRRIQLALMPLAMLRREHAIVMRRHNLISTMPKTGWKRQDFISHIGVVERAAWLQAEHFKEFGPGHERCPWFNDDAMCEAAKERRTADVSRETEHVAACVSGNSGGALWCTHGKCDCPCHGTVSRETERPMAPLCKDAREKTGRSKCFHLGCMRCWGE